MAHSAIAPAPVAQLVQLPCTVCGEHATTLRLPELPPKALKNIVRIIDVADSFLGAFGDLELPELRKDEHPLTAFPPAQLSGFLGVVHPKCIADQLEAQADGSH